MKRIISTAGFLILLFAFWAMAGTKDISDFDGNEWRTWDLSRRLSFISGFIAGTSYVIEENTSLFGKYMGEDYNSRKAFELSLDYRRFVSKPIKEGPKAERPVKPADKQEVKPPEAPAPYGPEAIPFKRVYSRDEVSLLLEQEYRDTKEWLSCYVIIGITSGQIVDGLNLFYDDFRNRQIKLSDAIYVIKKQILGTSKEEIEAITEWLRSPNRDFRKKYYKDKEGNPRNADFP